MPTWHSRIADARAPTEKTAVQRRIDATDRRIDELMYKLCGLTDDEVEIVEEATSPPASARAHTNL